MASRFYGLFIKVDKRWVRLYPRMAYRKESAVRIFQSLLIGLSLSGKHVELRPLKVQKQQWPSPLGPIHPSCY